MFFSIILSVEILYLSLQREISLRISFEIANNANGMGMLPTLLACNHDHIQFGVLLSEDGFCLVLG